jgi:hypothetical protein
MRDPMRDRTNRVRRPIRLAALLAISMPAIAGAGVADVIAAQTNCDAGGVCRFDVTVRHADAGWDHYADRFEILSEAGEILGTRVLRHPHVDEQPFTRSLLEVAVPAAIRRVRIRAHDSVHGDGGAEIVVELSRGT